MSSSTVPGTGVPVSPGTVAPIGGRVVAFVLDGLLAGVAYAVGLVLAATTGRPELALVGLVLAAAVGIAQWFAEAFTGATAGNALLGYRTVSVDTAAPAGLLKILLRQLVVAAGSLVCGVGAFVVVASGAFDDGPAQRGWHDKAAGTLVLRASALRPRGSGGAGAWNQAVERAVGGSPAPAAVRSAAQEQSLRPLPVVPPMPAMNAYADGAAGSVAPPQYEAAAPASSAATPDWSRLPEDAPAVPQQPDEPVVPPTRPRGGPVASAYAERLAAAQAAQSPPAWEETVAAQTVAPDHAAGAQEAPQASTTPHDPSEGRGPAPLITGYPGQGSGATPVPRAEDLGDLEYTRLRESMPTDRDAVLRMVFDTGQQFDVTGDGIVGRSPEGEMGIVHVVVIDDPARSVSKVHVSFGLTPAGDELWVIDRASVNGTVLVDPDGVAATLPAGTRALVGPGWTIRFGQRSARVERR